ncbi:FkbM family methyltransferase, partial [Desulfobacterales bacterium]|nr:FkbM family methyltransferase [Desulfobacterales bacterium]
ANDGKTNDPIFTSCLKYASKVILIEPNASLKNQLASSYHSFVGELDILTVAIHPSDTSADLFTVGYHASNSEPLKNSHANLTAISSFDKVHVIRMLKKYAGKYSDYFISTISVDCLPLSSIITDKLADYSILLQVDCEGFDAQVITSLGDCLPDIINYERKHLPSPDREMLDTWLTNNCYVQYPHGGDSLAIHVKTTFS